MTRFFKKSVKTAVPDDGNPPGALVLTKLVEWHRFGVGDEKLIFVVVFIVRGVSCVLLGSTEAALMGNFTPISRRSAKCAMRAAWVHSGALRAPLCVQGGVMAHFAGRREIGVKFPMRAASVDPKSTQVTPLTIVGSEIWTYHEV